MQAEADVEMRCRRLLAISPPFPCIQNRSPVFSAFLLNFLPRMKYNLFGFSTQSMRVLNVFCASQPIWKGSAVRHAFFWNDSTAPIVASGSTSQNRIEEVVQWQR